MPGCITRLDPIDVMYVREFEKPDEEAFAELEAVVGLKGRRFYGVFDEMGGGTGHVSSAASKTTQPV